MGSERPLGARRLRKRGGREGRRGHGVADAVSEGPIPLPPRLGISRSSLSFFGGEPALDPCNILVTFLY